LAVVLFLVVVFFTASVCERVAKQRLSSPRVQRAKPAVAPLGYSVRLLSRCVNVRTCCAALGVASIRTCTVAARSRSAVALPAAPSDSLPVQSAWGRHSEMTDPGRLLPLDGRTSTSAGQFERWRRATKVGAPWAPLRNMWLVLVGAALVRGIIKGPGYSRFACFVCKRA
jgi:hypothetical protein